MAGILTIVFTYLFIGHALTREHAGQQTAHGDLEDPFAPHVGIRRPSRTTDQSNKMSKSRHQTGSQEEQVFSSSNGWGFQDTLTEWPSKEEESTSSEKPMKKTETTTPYYEEVDPNRNGLLKDIGSINVGFGVGVGIPGNDPVKVGARVGVGFGESGLAGQLPIGQDIFPRQIVSLYCV
ncbi:hypothetical protein GCK32_015152 [Trichostrongylus colubriformis]|uniref:Uncharacterized protein n=1 Tax=Trichostrongylus colubriformis TaxID=6319 RepID=A0AAN8IK34_TRICO